LLALPLLALSGCLTVFNLTQGPVVYGGVRALHSCEDGPGWFGFDFPFSLAADTALLPVTALFELARWIWGWPSSPGY
jgi:uncharacterized protein YceK